MSNVLIKNVCNEIIVMAQKKKRVRFLIKNACGEITVMVQKKKGVLFTV